MTGRFPLFLERQLQLAIGILKEGGIVAFPTDTVYGLGASALIDGAVERIYRVKKRPRNLPLPLLLSDLSQLENVVGNVSQFAWLLARRFWPGGLTLVLPQPGEGSGTVAVRVPRHPIPTEIVRRLGAPITGTSANVSGESACNSAKGVAQSLGDTVDLILDGGTTEGGKGSTILDVTVKPPRILREGMVGREDLSMFI